MNKEIKFRLCHTAQDGSKTICYQTNRFLIGLNGTIYENYGKDWKSPMWEIIFDAEVFLQRFTGLKDKNGKYIYEGDIIKETWKENNPYGYRPDDWDTQVNIFIVKYEAPQFIFPKHSGFQTCIEEYSREIIGNIFQNPELLKN
jgi:hypothetical protein